MNEQEKLKLNYLTNEILDGFSSVKTNKFGDIYIKHIDNKMSYLVNKEVIYLSEKGKKRGMLPVKDKTKEVIQFGLWSDKKDDEINNLEIFVNGLKKSRGKVFLKRDIDFYSKEIEENENKLSELLLEKKHVLGPTLESFIERKTNELYILNSMFQDLEFKIPLFTRLEFEEMDNEELNEVYIAYMAYSSEFSKTSIQKMALLPYFLNQFFLCDNNPLIFFGIPVKSLTYNQLEIFNYGAIFKRILSEIKDGFDEKYYDNPQELIDLSEGRQNVKALLEKQAGDKNISLVGATKEDYERLGLADGAKFGNLNKALGKKTSLGFEEIIKYENPH